MWRPHGNWRWKAGKRVATEIIMPKVDMVMDNGTFVEWLKNEGERVEKGEPLFVVLTDKANIEVEAPASGVLAGLSAKPDDVIPVTTTIGYVLAPGEPLPEDTGRPTVPMAREQRAPGGEVKVGDTLRAASIVGPGIGTGKVRATPAARRLARDKGVDLASLIGRGPSGRIHMADVLAAAAVTSTPVAQGIAPVRIGIPLPEARRRDTIPLRGPRKIIADRLTFSAQVVPHIHLSLKVDVSEVVRLRDDMNATLIAKTGRGLSFTAILARAVAAVLPDHPYLNASLDDDQIILWDDVHLGVATDLDDYLVVPVIRDAGQKRLLQLATELDDLVTRARQKRLMPVEMSGSTFTISNLGMFGIESFTAIVNPPETAILSVGAIADWHGSPGNGGRPMMTFTANVDHRVVDGAMAARFLAQLKETLEKPYLLL